jgi:NRPS condensation-like uncharacterized protein
MQAYPEIKGDDQGKNGEKSGSQHKKAQDEGDMNPLEQVISEIIKNSNDQKRINPFFPGFQKK